jgi:DNA-binding Lrp family transcriptional regulator
MARKRIKSFPIRTADQLRVTSSPVQFAIIQTLQHLGPTAIGDLGPKIGRKPNSLHYHIRKLIDAGMVVQTGSRRSGARTEAIYDVVADRFIGADISEQPALQKHTNNTVAALLRLATRDFKRATQSPETLSEQGKKRNILAHRHTARLTDDQLSELNGCIEKIEEIFSSNIGSEDGQMCALTMVFTPLNTINR